MVIIHLKTSPFDESLPLFGLFNIFAYKFINPRNDKTIVDLLIEFK